MMIDNYFDWLIDSTTCREYRANRYRKLMNFLFDIEFTWTIEMDENRAKDGLRLRKEYEDEVIPFYVDDVYAPPFPTVLEVIIALARRMEREYLMDTDYGDRSPIWFWKMIENLGLIGQDDAHFDPDFCDEIVSNFLARNFLKSGQNGLFHTNLPTFDMRELQIWDQMQLFIDENYC